MPRNRTGDQRLAALDNIRLLHGNEQLRDQFHQLFTDDGENAMRLLNDDMLQFPSFYILQPEISKFEIGNQLSARNRMALDITGGILTRGQLGAYMHKPEDYPVLHWMLHTGYSEDNLGDQYDEVMDFTAILLVKTHQDKACLRPLEKMIFLRNRKGLYIYDAVWAFFESQDPDCMVMLARRLRSKDHRDVELARKLLGFLPCMSEGPSNALSQRRRALRWIARNRSYLRYTGESNLKGSNPYRFEVSLEAKYLQEPVTAGLELWPPVQEQAHGENFHLLDVDTRVLLSECSQKLHAGNKARWSKWIQRPLQEQIKAARRMAGEGEYHD